MLINGGVINGVTTINGEVLDEGVIAIGSGNLLTFSQTVGLIASGDLLVFKQRVTQYSVGDGDLLTITQSVSSIASGNLLTLSQMVTEENGYPYNPSNPTIPSSIPHYIVRNGWYPIFIIGSYVWPDNYIYDSFIITQNEGEDRLLTFTFLFRKKTPYGTINFEAFDGMPVVLYIYYLNGTSDRIFTGYINKIDVDIMNGSVTCSCVADRRNLTLNTYAAQTPLIGYYDEDVLGQSTDIFDQLEKRLSTVPYTVDVDRWGQLQLSTLMPANTANFEFNNSDVYGNNPEKGDPKVEKILRSRVVNTINIQLKYQYQRRYHGNATFDWDWGTDLCEFLLEGESLAQRATIEAAINSTGWVLNPPGVAYTEPPANGLYNCGGQQIAWSTVRVSGTNIETRKDKDGNTIKGMDGKPLKIATGGVVEDSRKLLAIGASWHMSYRWSQNVTETYTLSVTAPQSISQYGVIQQTDSAAVDENSDNSEWENYTSYKSTTGMQHEDDSHIYYLDYTPNRNKLYNAFNILVNKAKTSILKAHRDNRVTFSIPLNSSIEMYHTIYLNCSRIQAYGKVVRIEHIAKIADGDAYTVITIALCRSLSSASDSVFALPSIPTQIPPDPEGWFINISSIYGEEPSDNFKGFVGNRWKTEDDFTYGFRGTNTYKTDIQEQFIVKPPDINETYRNVLQLASAGSYIVSIPNHTLTINFL